LYGSLFDDCPDHWKVVPFPDAVDFQEGPGILAKDFHKIGIPLIRLSGVQQSTASLNGCNFLDPKKVAKKWDHFRLERGDLLVSTSATIGLVSEVGEETEGAVAYTGIIRMRPRTPKVLPGFIKYFMQSSAFVRQAESMAAGSVMRHFGPTHLRQMSFPVPPLAEQRAIAGVLGSLDDKIELNRRMNRTLEEMARALFKSWFVDFLPVRAKAEGRDPGLPADVAALFPDRLVPSPLGPIPQGWEVKPASEVLDINPKRKLEKGSVAPYLDMKNMPTDAFIAGDVIDREFKSGSKFINGDTLLARITPCLENGKTAYVDFLDSDQTGWGSTEYIVLRPQPPLPAEFAYFLARSDTFRAYAIQSMTGTSGRQRVPPTCFENHDVVCPPANTAKAFSAAVCPLMAKMRANETESRTLAALRDALLPQLLSGEVRVENAEQLAGRVS
jgi:type I restriction enzyme S subunit